MSLLRIVRVPLLRVGVLPSIAPRAIGMSRLFSMEAGQPGKSAFAPLQGENAMSEVLTISDATSAKAIVGRAGVTIKRLQADSGARLQMNFETNQLMIRGDAESIQKAKQLVQKVIDRVQIDSSSTAVEEVLEVNPQLAKAIVGRGGSRIKKIQEDSNTRIRVSFEDNRVTIKGGPENITKAKALFRETEKEMEDYMKLNNSPTAIKETLELVPEAGRSVVGRGGAVIKSIASDSGARLRYDFDTNVLTLRGEPSQVAAAKKRVEEIIKGTQQQQSGGF